MVFMPIMAIPNLISISRIFFGISFFCLYPESYAVIFLFIGAFSDVLDGFIARQFGLCSRLGEIIDPISDKIFWMLILSRLYLSSIIPKWFLFVCIARDMMFFSAFIFMFINGINNFKASWSGKLTAVIIGSTIILSLYEDCQLCMRRMYLICIVFMIFNILDYCRRLIK
ncbi:CDP-alcohol phosphatidyltransferase family protein [Candidatus Cytomitobacter indipagum]|uniref:CDP-diacylglycerol--glycerol-3-phosphate 3-phosphatidyltransferase n=1 Tax=Candidatus Cytomitobacter indipagum TaxID=2601575 RepID=A0A5C0UG22_9PROT|nr:CDP-alcohol phosphatidyltransferase family protein [Candidatus Cytomitobacter indipagum]QEK38212.1 CDP-alcohol phosphatidyltransferase family protein [Candidatus Cytomitobacter indipagum]